jgi:HCO3- transporter family
MLSVIAVASFDLNLSRRLPSLRDDITRRSKYYVSDWTDAFKDLKKVIPAVLFLYFACLSPAVSFGTIASQITDGSIGIVEFLVSCGGSGMVSNRIVVTLFPKVKGVSANSSSQHRCSRKYRRTPSSVVNPCPS